MDEILADERNRRRINAIVIIFAIAIYTFFSMHHSNGHSVSVGVDDTKIGIAVDGYDTIFIDFSEISGIELRDSFEIGMPVAGIDEEDFAYGTFRNELYGDYFLCCDKRIEKVIVIETEKEIYVINRLSEQATASDYDKMKTAVVE